MSAMKQLIEEAELSRSEEHDADGLPAEDPFREQAEARIQRHAAELTFADQQMWNEGPYLPLADSLLRRRMIDFLICAPLAVWFAIGGSWVWASLLQDTGTP
jgi:hypothetical protein